MFFCDITSPHWVSGKRICHIDLWTHQAQTTALSQTPGTSHPVTTGNIPEERTTSKIFPTVYAILVTNINYVREF